MDTMDTPIEEELARMWSVVDFLARVTAADVARRMGETALADELGQVSLEHDDRGLDGLLTRLMQLPQMEIGDGERHHQVVALVFAAVRYARYSSHLTSTGPLNDNDLRWLHRSVTFAERAAAKVSRIVLNGQHEPLLPGSRTELVAMLMADPPLPAAEAIATVPVLTGG